MKILITFMVILSVVSVATGQIVRNLRRKVSGDRRAWMSVAVMLSLVLVLLSVPPAYEKSFSLCVLTMNMMPSVCTMWFMSSFLSENRRLKRFVVYGLLANPLLIAFNLSCMNGCVRPLSEKTALFVSSGLSFMMVLFFLYGLFDRIGKIKVLMKSSSVWTVVCMTVDIFYVHFIVSGIILVQLGLEEAGVLLLGGTVSATGLRIMTDSKFLIWQRQETAIAESMKITSMPSATDASHIDEVYKELYARIVEYFEARKPFLDSDLTINDLVKDLYSNKLYISRAISQFTGRNFCQFVNYYRVMHSMECFRQNRDMRVHELATMSGFNSVVSFNMAFRLFMGENPSEWCRKERGRLVKSGK